MPVHNFPCLSIGKLKENTLPGTTKLSRICLRPKTKSPEAKPGYGVLVTSLSLARLHLHILFSSLMMSRFQGSFQWSLAHDAGCGVVYLPGHSSCRTQLICLFLGRVSKIPAAEHPEISTFSVSWKFEAPKPSCRQI